MNFLNIRAIAKYEAKLLLRTARFWILCGIGFVMAGFMTAAMILFNIFGSGEVQAGGMLAVNTIGYYSLLYFGIAINIVMIFFVFNFISKDDFSNVRDVLLSKSLTSFEIIIGKYLGLIIPIILVCLFTMFFSLIMGLIFLDVPVKFENYIYYFLIINIPSMLYISAFEFFIVLSIKNRFAVIFLSFGYVAVIWFWLSSRFYNLLDFGCYGITVYTSDLVGFANIDTVILQRILYVILGFVFIGLSILFYPRLRQFKREYSLLKISMIIMVLVSSAIVYYFPYEAGKRAKYRKSALEAEKKYTNYKPPCLKHYSMKINLLPRNREIEVLADIKILNDTDKKLNNLIFSLNPGLKINRCLIEKDNKQIPVKFDRDYSIINIDVSDNPVLRGDSTNIIIDYDGRLDDRAFFLEFDELKKGYEDIILQEVTGAIYYWLGRDYSFLLPEAGWYPTMGAGYGYQYPEKRRICFSTSDISIKVPEDHITLTQGELVSVEENKEESIFTWVSDIPVPKFSINTGKYKTVSAIIDSIDCTLYYSPLHNKNITFFSDVSDTLKGYIAEKLKEIGYRTGLSYPYKSFSLIEVPIQIAEFSKSWDTPNVMNQPGISMMKEGGILVANFEGRFNRLINRAERRGEDTSKERIKLEEILDSYLSRSGFFESRIDHRIIPNYWEFRFDPKGNLYPLLTFGMNNFVTEWITGAVPVSPVGVRGFQGLFYVGSDEGSDEGGSLTVAGNIRFSVGIDSIYKLLEEKTLSEFSPMDDPELFRVIMNIKGEAMIKSLREMMGNEKFGELLKTFVSKYSFDYPTINLFKETAEDIYKGELDDFFDNWLYETQIPGYQLKSVEAYQIESETPSYQIIVRLKNGEKGEGYVKLEFKTEEDLVTKFSNFKSYEEKEIKIVVPDKPLYVDVEPFFSLNRESFRENFYISEHKKLKKGEESFKTVSTIPDISYDEIIVDNLDDNFYVEDLTEKSLLRPGTDKSKKNEFRPLAYNLPNNPNAWGSFKKWRLRNNKYAYGKYRHTSLVKKKGSGKHTAVWKVNISEPGEYFVYFYINDEFFKKRLGKIYEITVYHDDGKEELLFPARSSENGWNELGTYYFSKGDFKVELSDKSDGFILADAVKWVKK